jgi:propanol-preferring alcohol dehydrogenase
MKAARLRVPGSPLVIEEVELPRPGPGEVLIKVRACGVCHTDLHIASGEWTVPRLPLVPGHEVVGEIVEIGSGVVGLKPGDRYGVSWIYSTCGHCEFCASDRERFCPAFVSTGYIVDGGFAEYIKAPATHVVAVPAELPYAQAAPLYCAGLTAYRAIKTSGLRVGETVAVWGAGGLGQCAIQIARAMGARVIAVDVVPSKLALASELGAAWTVNAAEEKPGAAISARGGAHVVVNFAPSAEAIVQGFEALRSCGTLVLVGLPPGNFTLPIIGSVRKGVRILTCAVGSRQDLREVLALAAQGRVKTRVETARLDSVNEVLARLREGRVPGRVVLEFPGLITEEVLPPAG